MSFALVRKRDVRARRLFSPNLGNALYRALCEPRCMAAPIFTPASAWLVRATSQGTGQQNTDVDEEAISAVAQEFDSQTEFDDSGSGLSNTFTAQGTVSNILETTTGPDGGSMIHAGVTHSVTETADVSFYDGTNQGANNVGANSTTTGDIDAADGSGTATWTITDPSDPSNTSAHLTATFDLHWTNGVGPNNGFLFGAPTLTFVSNQISVFVNTAPDGNGGLEIWDNTTEFGPTLVVFDPTAGTGQNPPSFDATYQTGQTVALPALEAITYTSTVGAGTVPGANADPGQYTNQQSFKWDFFLSNG